MGLIGINLILVVPFLKYSAFEHYITYQTLPLFVVLLGVKKRNIFVKKFEANSRSYLRKFFSKKDKLFALTHRAASKLKKLLRKIS